jgi:hypothetical protein
MGARIIPFLKKVTETFSYLVIDPLKQTALIQCSTMIPPPHG